MKKYLGILLFFTLIEITSASAQIISGVGSTQVNPISTSDLQGAWVGTGASSPTSFTVTNAPNSSAFGANGIFSTLSTPESIVGNTGVLTLTGMLTGAVPTTDTFEISLFDTTSGSPNELDYQFNWSSFAGSGPVTISTNVLAPNPSFNGTVGSWLLIPGGSPLDSSTVSFTFDKVQAGPAPEPSPYAMLGLGLGLLGFFLYRRQKSSSCA